MENDRTYTAFAGSRLIASGSLTTTILQTKNCLDRGTPDQILVFDDQTGEQIDFDYRGSPDDVLQRLSLHPRFAPIETPAAKPRTGPGRPRLGVVCREVSLLPRHWEWLESQPHGISATLRRLVDEARRREPAGKARARSARDAAAKFMWTMAGNLPGFEEASRALYADNLALFDELIGAWPADVRNHVQRLVQDYAKLAASGTCPRAAEGRDTPESGQRAPATEERSPS
ncbi:MAG: DUF2239 family protein [Pseudomonadota bacterium]